MSRIKEHFLSLLRAIHARRDGLILLAAGVLMVVALSVRPL